MANQRGADNILFRNDGDGGFVRVREGPVVSDGGRSFSAVRVNVDVDGLVDLHVLNGRDGGSGEVDFVYRNLGDGTFERVRKAAFVRDTLPSGGAAWADYDEDGDPDLLLPVHASGQPSRLYRNDGDWSFTEAAAESGLDASPLPAHPASSVASWVDCDNDADLDLVIAVWGGASEVYLNDGSGRLEPEASGDLGETLGFASSISASDIDAMVIWIST